MTLEPCSFVAQHWHSPLRNPELRNLIAKHLLWTGCDTCTEYLRAHFRVRTSIEVLPNALKTRRGRNRLLPLLLPDEPIMLTQARQ